MHNRAERGNRAIALLGCIAIVVTMAPVAGAAENYAPAQARVASATQASGGLLDLLSGIPILPKMTIGFQPKAYPALSRAAGRAASNGSSNFGVADGSGSSPVQTVLLSPMAVWASGSYGWTAGQRAAFGTAEPSDAVLVTGADSDPSLMLAPWGGPVTSLTPRVSTAVEAACKASSSLTCALSGIPTDLKPRAAAAITLTAVRHRLSMTREEKGELGKLLIHLVADDPNASFTVNQTDVPALPTTFGSDATGRVVEASLFGLVAPPESGSVPSVPYTSLRLWDSGVGWPDLEPTMGHYNWAPLDRSVVFAERTGKEVLLVLGPVPQWASSDPMRPDKGWGMGSGGPLTPEGQVAFSRLIDAIVTRYGDRITAYEMWNEANLPIFWAGTPADMAAMTKVVFDAVRAHLAHSKVYSASATTRVPGSIYRFFPAYLDALKAKGWPVDGFAVHAYPDADGSASEMTDFVAQFKAYLSIAGAPDLPIMNTEVNYGLAGPGPAKPHQDISQTLSAGWLSRTFIDAVRLGIHTTYWFAWTSKYYEQLGIQLNPTTKETAEAWATTYTWLVGATFISCADPGSAVMCSFERDGRPFWIGYADNATVVDAPPGATSFCTLANKCGPMIGSKSFLDVRPILIR